MSKHEKNRALKQSEIMEKSMKNKGFTLVELVVVLGIMAALAAIVIPIVARFAGEENKEITPTETPNYPAYHNSEYSITCWLINENLQCVPDSEIPTVKEKP